VDPLLAQLTHRAFPDLAAALRSEKMSITREWDGAVSDGSMVGVAVQRALVKEDVERV